MTYQQPTAGHPIARGGKPYIWVTWLAKLLGGNQCVWSAWFKAHYKYAKFEEEAEQLAEWNRDHSRMMREIRSELEENGWRCAVEAENEFKLEGASAVVAGKPDLIGTMPGHVLVVDGKTGRERDCDWWQVLIYLFAIQLSRPDLVGNLTAEVHYKRKRMTVTPNDLTDSRRDDIVQMVKTIAGDTQPPKSPSRHECKRCNIGAKDCPQRFQEPVSTTSHVEAF